MPAWWIPFIPPAVGLANSLFGRRQSRRNTSDTIAANKELAEYQYSKNLEMWQRQNAYNTPENQMQRFTDAGLNKNLIYGQGTPGNAMQQPKYERPETDYSGRLPIQLPEMVSQYQNVGLKDAQIKAVKQQTQLSGVTTQLKEIEVLISSKTIDPRTKKILVNLQQEIVKLGTLELQQEYKKKMLTKADVDLSKSVLDRIFKENRNEFFKVGITSSDNVLFRFIVRLMTEAGIEVKDLFGQAPDGTKANPAGLDRLKF